jgi:hypothetical protein
MKSAKHGRLTAPAIMIIGGTGFTAATVAAQGWQAAIPIAALAAIGAIGYYVWGGRDSDMGAIALKDPVWPFVLILGVEAIAFIAGLAVYGAHDAR